MAEKVEVVHGFTKKAIITGIVGIIIMHMLYTLQVDGMYGMWLSYVYPTGGFVGWFVGPMGPFLNAFGWSTVFVLIIALINQIAKKSFFTRQETMIAITMIIAGGGLTTLGVWPVFWEDLYTTGIGFSMGIQPATAVAKFKANTAWVFNYDVDYWNTVGPKSTFMVDWVFFFPKIAWASLFVISFVFLLYFFLLLFRRLMVDVEALDFPTGSLHANMVELTQPSNTGTTMRIFKSKWFWIFFAIQSLWLLACLLPWAIKYPAKMNYTFYWGFTATGCIPDTAINIYPRFDLQAYIATPIVLYLFLEPWQIGWYGLLSIDVLAGFIVGYLIWWVIYPEALVAAGTWPRPALGSSRRYTDTMLGHTWSYGASPNTIVVGLGFIVGLAIMTLIRNRGTVASVLKGIAKEPAPEFDRDRPIPYRITWLLFFAFFALFIASSAMINAYLPYVLVWILFFMLLVLGGVRLGGETAGYFGNVGGMAMYGYPLMFAALLAMTPFIVPLYTTGYSATNVDTLHIFTFSCGGGFWLGIWTIIPATILFGLASYKSARRTGTSQKDVFKAWLLAIVIAVVVTGIFRIFWAHVWNLLAIPSPGPIKGLCSIQDTWARIDRNLVREFFAVTSNVSQMTAYPALYVANFAIGVAICVVLPFLRSKWTWLRVSVAGIALGVLVGGMAGMAPIFALIIKYIVLKVGGTRLFQEKMVPAAVGAIMGMLIMFIIWIPFGDNYFTLLNNPRLWSP